MGISIKSIVNNLATSGTSLQTPAFGTNPGTGDTIVVFYSTFSVPTDTHSAPTDTQSNSYSQIGSEQTRVVTNNLNISMWIANNITGGSSFKVTGHSGAASTSGIGIVAWCLTGGATSAYNGDVVGSNGTGNPSIGPTSPAPAANSIFIGGTSTDSGSNGGTAGSGWQFETNSTQSDNTNGQDCYTEDLSAGVSSSTHTFTWSITGNNWVAIGASFKPAVAGLVPYQPQYFQAPANGY